MSVATMIELTDTDEQSTKTSRRLTVADEERLSLAIQAAEPGKSAWLAARNELVAANTDLSTWYTKRVVDRFPGMDFGDIEQEASMGLMRAAESFDYTQGRFTTYAIHWMKKQVHQAYRDTGKLIRIPRYLYAQRKLDGLPAVTAMASQIPAFDDIAPAKVTTNKDHERTEAIAEQALSFHDEPTRDLLRKYCGIGRPQMQIKQISIEMGVPEYRVNVMISQAISVTRRRFLKQGVVMNAKRSVSEEHNA